MRYFYKFIDLKNIFQNRIKYEYNIILFEMCFKLNLIKTRVYFKLECVSSAVLFVFKNRTESTL